jgi:hypothetical protein
MCGLLLLAMSVVRHFGGWSSLHGSWAWLKAEPKWILLIVSAPVIMVALALGATAPPPLHHIVAYAIEAFFLAYAFIAAGRAFWSAGIASIASWFRS